MRRLVLAVAALALGSTLASAQAVQVNPSTPAYQKASGVSGTLKSVGSDTMNNLMALWRDEFLKIYPTSPSRSRARARHRAARAHRGPRHFGPMSRPMKAEEMDNFEKKFGYKPTRSGRASMRSRSSSTRTTRSRGSRSTRSTPIFSKTRKGGYAKDITTWGDLGLTGEWQNRPITLYGRNSASGTYAYFKEHALLKGDYKDSVKEQPGSARRLGRRERPLRHRVQRHRVQDLRASRPCSSPKRTEFFDGRRTRTSRAQVPALTLPVHLPQQGARQAPRPAGQGVHQAHPEQGRPGGRREGRVPARSRPAIVAEELKKVD